MDEGNPLEAVGQSARRAARALQALEAGDRTKILQAIASKLRAAAPAILAANAADVADSGDVARELRQRLGLSSQKLETVAKGVEALAHAKDPVFFPASPFFCFICDGDGVRVAPDATDATLLRETLTAL